MQKGHGRRPASAFNAEVIYIPHHDHKKGDSCSECHRGKLHQLSHGSLLQIIGRPFLGAKQYKPERLRCALCGKVFRATVPGTIERVDITAKATVSLLKYRGGVPFYRQSQIQHLLGVPLSPTELYEMTEDVANAVYSVFKELYNEAAQGDCIHNDDTKAKILDLINCPKKQRDKRKGVFTTSILSKGKTHSVALYCTGRKHAGENLEDLLNQRLEKEVPIQACDGLSHNLSKNHTTHVAKCLVHARRLFYHLYETWPKEMEVVLNIFGDIFENEKQAPEDPEKRLRWHQRKTQPCMEKLKTYCKSLIDEKKAEPNSGLGKAIKYLENHWEGLTLFLRMPGVPLTNNENEQLIKRAVLNRKNAYFFKNETGAKIGDILLSVIETCALNAANPWEYLVAIQKNQHQVRQCPKNWLPWNYQDQIRASP